MRQARLLGEGVSTYHCINRVVDRRFVFGDEEKDYFVRLMRKLERFCGVEVLTYCVMSNHVHLLVRIPPPQVRSDEALLERARNVHRRGWTQALEEQLAEARREGDLKRVTALRATLERRMWNLAQFMKALKQGFSVWFNKRTQRQGTLWEDRYKSVLVEGRRAALLTMAAYIDLNPVRAGLVMDPKDYRWCGYGEAAAGVRIARRGLALALEQENESSHWRHVGCEYRRMLFGDAQPAGDVDARTGERVKRGIRQELLDQVEQRGGRLTRSELLRLRVRYFADGWVIGSRAFVDEQFQRMRSRFGAKRENGARRMRGGDWGELCSLRDLRVAVFG